MKILTLDVETTGLDVETDQIIELGAVLYDWDSKKPLVLESNNVSYSGKISPKITKITGIEQFMVEKPYAISLKAALLRLKNLANVCDYYMAHNAGFDFSFLRKASITTNISLPFKPTIDTRYDLPYDEDQTNFKLNYLLADHGLFNPFAHRAVFDCMSTFMLAREYNLDDIIELTKSEMITVEAVERNGAGINYSKKDLARDKGFRWDSNRKKWLLDIKKIKFKKLKETFPFHTKIVDEIPF